jgi:hypothetical protein
LNRPRKKNPDERFETFRLHRVVVMSEPTERASTDKGDRFLPMLVTLLIVIATGMIGALACDEDVSLGKGSGSRTANGPGANGPSTASTDQAVGGVTFDVRAD